MLRQPLLLELATREITLHQAQQIMNDYDIYFVIEALQEDLERFGCTVQVHILVSTEPGYLEGANHADCSSSD